MGLIYWKENISIYGQTLKSYGAPLKSGGAACSPIAPPFLLSIFMNTNQQQQISKEFTPYLIDWSNYTMIMDEACDVEVCDKVDPMSSSEKENVDID